ncbi:hypothetical protein HSX11_12220 [Oxalobacteraceae bacterium]|nr:hypothetical protein [Oxalobacteraceae bacterium]
MSDTIHRNFKQLADAQSAREALLASGFKPASVTLNSHDTALAGDVTTSTVEGVLDAMTPGAKPDKARLREGALLTVDTDDEEQRRHADAILQRFNAIDT